MDWTKGESPMRKEDLEKVKEKESVDWLVSPLKKKRTEKRRKKGKALLDWSVGLVASHFLGSETSLMPPVTAPLTAARACSFTSCFTLAVSDWCWRR